MTFQCGSSLIAECKERLGCLLGRSTRVPSIVEDNIIQICFAAKLVWQCAMKHLPLGGLRSHGFCLESHGSTNTIKAFKSPAIISLSSYTIHSIQTGKDGTDLQTMQYQNVYVQGVSGTHASTSKTMRLSTPCT